MVKNGALIRRPTANPGGEIAPEDVFGRNRLIEALWRTLGGQSVVMVAERRIGKTTVVKKMRAQVPPGMHLVYRDVEGIRSPLEFAEAVARDVDSLLSLKSRAANKLTKLFSHLAGAEIGGVVKFPANLAPHWKSLLEATLEDLLRQELATKFVFAWDELPIMIDKILRECGEGTAMDVLDTLRGLRQEHSNLRMIYTGSIGLHHVLGKLRAGAHLNDTTNDMRSIEVDELSAEDGARLALALLEGEQLTCDSDGVPAMLSSLVDHVPFYVHQVVRLLSDKREKVSAEVVGKIVAEALVDAQDPWHLGHFLDRLEERYGEEKSELAKIALAILANSDQALSLSELAKLVKSTNPRTDASPLVAAVLDGNEAPLRDVVKLLARDHYVKPNIDNRYQFRFSLIRRWWKLQA